jgi:hypothetical protein
MKTIARVLLLLIITALMLLLARCSESSPECDMTFDAYKTEDFKIYVRGNFPSDSRFEIWASHQQSSQYPIPGLFLHLQNQTDFVNGEIVGYYRDYYASTFHYDVKSGEYIYVRIRIHNACGFSAFKTYLVRVNHEIKEAGN